MISIFFSPYFDNKNSLAEVIPENTSLNEFLDLYDILVSKGFSEQLAEKTAIDMMEGKEPKAKPSVRFAKIYGVTTMM